ncbi:MAG: 4Fe-4S dicluster domain-containing protein [Candidatus Bathyarchaeota archaeon]|nr:MAG: 4Fe-4S dicluster domain-containing protein [Candidatus Bathyarchaeota archaeon]
MITVETYQTHVETSGIDKRFKYEISRFPGGEKLLDCFQCGTCTSDCPIARFSDTYRPRQIIRMAQLGLRERVLSSETIWLCASCFTCSDHCPRGVEVADVMRVLRNLTTQQGHIPRIFRELGSSILESGYAYRIPKRRIDRREALGLPLLPKCNPESLAKSLRNVRFRQFLSEKGR